MVSKSEWSLRRTLPNLALTCLQSLVLLTKQKKHLGIYGEMAPNRYTHVELTSRRYDVLSRPLIVFHFHRSMCKYHISVMHLTLLSVAVLLTVASVAQRLVSSDLRYIFDPCTICSSCGLTPIKPNLSNGAAVSANKTSNAVMGGAGAAAHSWPWTVAICGYGKRGLLLVNVVDEHTLHHTTM